jgi:hypothetical protein
MVIFKQAKQADYDLAVKVIRTTCDTTEESAIRADCISEILRQRVEVNKYEISVLRDAFP